MTWHGTTAAPSTHVRAAGGKSVPAMMRRHRCPAGVATSRRSGCLPQSRGSALAMSGGLGVLVQFLTSLNLCGQCEEITQGCVSECASIVQIRPSDAVRFVRAFVSNKSCVIQPVADRRGKLMLLDQLFHPLGERSLHVRIEIEQGKFQTAAVHKGRWLLATVHSVIPLALHECLVDLGRKVRWRGRCLLFGPNLLHVEIRLKDVIAALKKLSSLSSDVTLILLRQHREKLGDDRVSTSLTFGGDREKGQSPHRAMRRDRANTEYWKGHVLRRAVRTRRSEGGRHG